jgi:hypothetical protein
MDGIEIDTRASSLTRYGLSITFISRTYRISGRGCDSRDFEAG